jgi:hypothetical protein
MSASIANIQLGEFLKKENWEFHYALSSEPEQAWIGCFQKVCTTEKTTANIKGFSFLHKRGEINHYASITGGLYDSEGELCTRLEDLINKTNKKYCEMETASASK